MDPMGVPTHPRNLLIKDHGAPSFKAPPTFGPHLEDGPPLTKWLVKGVTNHLQVDQPDPYGTY